MTPRRAVVLRAFFFGWTLLGLPWVPGLLEATLVPSHADPQGPLSRRAASHLAWVEDHLEAPFFGYYATDVLGEPFAAVALSHFATGLLGAAIRDPEHAHERVPALSAAVERVLVSSPYGDSPAIGPFLGKSPETRKELGDHNLYLAHTAIVLGAYRLVSADPAHDTLHRRIVEHLRARSLADGDFHARSYPGSAKWPADQSVVLAAIHLYDRLHGTRLSDAPIAGWLKKMARTTDPATGLHRSSISPLSYARWPRGCALSWTSFYMGQFAPDEAQALYRRYRETMSASFLGMGGFREYPEAAGSMGMDVDSGPILFGVGMAATGIGLAPARLFGDPGQTALIEQTAATFGLPFPPPFSRRMFTAPVLGEAILFEGETATFWFDAPQADAPQADAPQTDAPKTAAPFPDDAPLPWFAWGVLVMWGLGPMGMWRLWRRERSRGGA